MKKRGQRVEEHKEHKLKEKVREIAPVGKILKALEEIDKRLSSASESRELAQELTIAKSKIASQREKLETLELLKKGGEKTISSLEQEIGTIQSEILGFNNKKINQFILARKNYNRSLEECAKKKEDMIKSEPEQSKQIEASIQEEMSKLSEELTVQNKQIEAEIQGKIRELDQELNKKDKNFKILENLIRKPLQPSEMVEALIYSPYCPGSLDEVLAKQESLIPKSSASELIGVANSLISISTTEALKYKIDIRKDFLKTTKEKLPLLTKLPNKPGDEDNIGGFYKLWNQFSKFWSRSGDKELSDRANITDFILNMKNLQEVFFFDEQTNVKLRLDFSMKSIDVLIVLRGYLKMWSNPELMPKTKQIDFIKGG